MQVPCVFYMSKNEPIELPEVCGIAQRKRNLTSSPPSSGQKPPLHLKKCLPHRKPARLENKVCNKLEHAQGHHSVKENSIYCGCEKGSVQVNIDLLL